MLFQSSKKIFNPLSVSSCLYISWNTLGGIVAISDPAFATSFTWSMFLIDADKIFVFKEGNIINSGDHDFLINDCEEYKSLYKKQLQ